MTYLKVVFYFKKSDCFYPFLNFYSHLCTFFQIFSNFFKFFDPFSGAIFIFRIYLDLFNILKFFKTLHDLFHYSVRKRSADALNRVRSQAKLKDATKRIGFLSRYKLLYQFHFLNLFHQKYIKCIWIHFLFKFFIKIIILEIFL